MEPNAGHVSFNIGESCRDDHAHRSLPIQQYSSSDCYVIKKNLRRLIHKLVYEKTNSLAEVKMKAAKVKQVHPITVEDNNYIERKYKKYCTQFWLEETAQTIKALGRMKGHTVFEDFLCISDSIQNLSQIPAPWNVLYFYNALMDHRQLISDSEDIDLANTWKQLCLEQILSFSSTFKTELEFITAFLNLLSSLKCYKSYIDELNLYGFFHGNLSFDEIKKKITSRNAYSHDENHKEFLRTINKLDLGSIFYIKGIFQSVIDEFNKPPLKKLETKDGRDIIEVIGASLVISEISEGLEEMLASNPSVIEIRFIGGSVIHVDASLKKDIWRGKNVVVFAKLARIHGEIVWNISGKDCGHFYPNPAGTDAFGNGYRGSDGIAGESGGNALIQVQDMDQPQNFQIISNGGKGGRGQEGGKGKDGLDGEGFSHAEFKQYFPNVAKLNHFRAIDNLQTTLNYINRCDITKNHYMDERNWCSRDIFVDGETPAKQEITFSSYGTLQAFLVCKGSSGQQEGKGGQYGLGGQGGYNGEIISNIPDVVANSIAEPGADGDKGDGGLYGSLGKKGWDIGYTDCKHWRKTEYFGLNCNSKLKLNFYDNDWWGHGRIWCPYYKQYVTVTSTTMEQKSVKTYQHRNNTRDISRRQLHSEASRKKTISERNVLSEYSKYLTVGTNILQNFRTSLENMERHASIEIEKVLEREQTQTMQQRVTRNISFFLAENQQNNSILLNEPEQDGWNVVMNIEKLMFSGKYSVLFEALLIVTDNALVVDENGPELTAEASASFLEIANETNIFFHEVLGPLNQYIYENTIELNKSVVSELYRNTPELSGFKAISKQVMKVFILEAVNDLSIECEDVKQCYNDYIKYLNKRERDLNNSLKSFIAEFSNQEYQTLWELWRDCIRDRSLLIQLDRKIKKHKLLRKNYEEIAKLLEGDNDYNWNECCAKEKVMKAFKHYIRKCGALSKTYREILAVIFDINIRCFIEKNNRYYLTDDHNAQDKLSNRGILYLTIRRGEILEMNANEMYFRLKEDRKRKGKLYMKILTDIDLMTDAIKMKDYFDSKAFLNCSDDFDMQRNRLFDAFSAIGKEHVLQIIESDGNNSQQKKILVERLQKLSTPYIGNSGILYYLLHRFSIEGIRVTSLELCYIINYILASVANGYDDLDIYCWIIASKDQKNWMSEFLLMNLQNYFKNKMNEKLLNWRTSLSNIPNKKVVVLFQLKLDMHKSVYVTEERINNIFSWLIRLPNIDLHALERLGLSEWPYCLKEQFIHHELSSTSLENEQVSSALYYLMCIENQLGEIVTLNLLNSLIRNRIPSTSIMKVLSGIHDQQWIVTLEDAININGDIDAWMKEIELKVANSNTKDRNVDELYELMYVDANNSKGILQKIQNIRDSVKKMSETSVVGSVVIKFTEKIRKLLKNKSSTSIEEMLSLIDKAVKKTRGFNLRDTQKMSVLMLLKNDRDTLAQISTGEGKSLIIVALSIIKACFGEKVHVITSSPVLAKRDAKIYKDLYDIFNVNVGHNCIDNLDKRRQAFSNNQVIYSDLASLQRDYLLDKFHEKNILGDHKFENVVIDEADSMLVDKGNNMLYLAHDIAGFDKLETVYIYIWQLINNPDTSALDIESIKDLILYDLFGIVKRNDLLKIDSSLSDNQINTLWHHLLEYKILDYQGKILDVQDINDLEDILPGELHEYAARLYFFLSQRISRNNVILVPNYLKGFIEMHLAQWIVSARTALVMEEFRDYVVDTDRTGYGIDRSANVTILDRDTGTDQANSQYDEALHQFLQLKHGCKLSLQCLKSLYISNVLFFKLYDHLYGLTGTLGSQPERDLLKKIHDVDFVTLPTSKVKRFHLKMPIHCTDESEWIRQLLKESLNMTAENRSILIICDTVRDVTKIETAFSRQNVPNVRYYKRDFEEIEVFNKLPPKHIIIATNLAGRGTDIMLTDELKKAGGLHVCMSYLAKNSRTGEQGFGRASRCGEKGSGRLIILIPQDSKSILELTKQRDSMELQRLSEIKSYYELRICTEESYFKKFKDCYEHLNKYLINMKQSSEMRRILLDNCLDKWALWLDGNNAYINNISDDHCRKSVDESLHEFLRGLKRLKIGEWSKWCDRNPIRLVRLGKYLTKTNKEKQAMELFDEVIEREPDFSEGAHYYKAYVIGTNLNPKNEYKKDTETIKFELQNARRLLFRHSLNCKISLAVITKLKKVNPESVIQINSYEEQKHDICTLYSNFCQSIDSILGRPVERRTFINKTVNEELSQITYKDLLQKKILKCPKVRKEFTQEEVNTIEFNYGITHDKLFNFLKSYRNKRIDEDIFRKELRDELKLPSKKVFWKELINNSILVQERRFIAVGHEDLDKYLACSKTVIIENSQLCQDELLKIIGLPNVLAFDSVLLNDHLIIESTCIIDKLSFKEITGEEIYNFLKKKNIFSSNKIASINVENIKSTHLSLYDSIALAHFVSINIIPSDAEKILSSLVTQKIIEKSENEELYRLKATQNEIKKIVLPFCPAYENSVKALLFHMFTYRMTLQEIEKQLNDGCSPIQLKLISNIETVLYWELVDNRILRPVIVNNNLENIEGELRDMYVEVMNKEDIKAFFVINDLILNEQDFDCIFDHLIERRWIIPHDREPNKYTIQQEPDIETTLTNLQAIKYEQVIRHLLKLRVKFPNAIHDIYNSIVRLKKTLKVNNYQLLSLMKFAPALFANPEVQLFSLNALDEIIQANNATWMMTLMTVLFGVCQICTGLAMVLHSKMRYVMHLSTALIEEGMNDILYGLTEREMSWENYLQYKGASITLTYSRLVNNQGNNAVHWSEFGMRIKNRILDYINKAPIDKVHEREAMDGVRRILDTATAGINASSSYAGLDARIESFLGDLCSDAEDKIITEIENLLESHEIFKHIANCSEVREQKDIEKVITYFLNEKKNIVSLVIAGKKNYDHMSNQMQKAMTAAMKLDEYGLKLRIMFEGLFIKKEHMNEIVNTAEKLMYNLMEDLKSIVALQEDATYTEELSDESNNYWRSFLCEQMKNAIQQSIISRIRTHCGDTIIRGFKKNMKKIYMSYKSSLNPVGDAPQHKQPTTADETGSALTDVLTNMYHEHLSKIFNRMRNVELFSAILEENAPIEKAYIAVLVNVIPHVLKLNGLTIVVNSESGSMDYYSSEIKTTDLAVIYISLSNGKFQIHSSAAGTMQRTPLRYTNNLFEALSEVVALDMSGEGFAKKIADRIKQDDAARRMVAQLWVTADSDGPSQSDRDARTRHSGNQNDQQASQVENGSTDYGARYIENNFRTIVAEHVSKWLQNLPTQGNVNDNSEDQINLGNSDNDEMYSLEGFSVVQL